MERRNDWEVCSKGGSFIVKKRVLSPITYEFNEVRKAQETAAQLNEYEQALRQAQMQGEGLLQLVRGRNFI